MSGICAVWRHQNPGATRGTLSLMCRGLSLSDSETVDRVVAGESGLGVSAQFGTQQLYWSDRLVVVCDAEFYNEKEVDELAGGNPLPLREASPSTGAAAALAALYERMGEGLVEKLRGDFSFIIWDPRKKVMLAATDRFGVHPIVYCETPQALLIASRIDALLQTREINPQINPRAIANLLNFSVTLAPETIVSQVRRLAPGNLLTASSGALKCRPYWDMEYAARRDRSEAEMARQLEALVAESVAAHCKNDAFEHLGTFLSGGTDSSTVSGLMSRLGRGRVKTFSIGFDEQSFDELEYARIAAKHFGADHHEYIVKPADCWDALPKIIRCFDEPFGNSSAIPTYFCAKLAADHGVKVLLAGDGGDELFGGNERYRLDKILELYQGVPRGLRKGLIEPMLGALPVKNGIVGKARNYIKRSNIPSPARFFSYHFLCTQPQDEIFEPGFMESLAGYSVLDWPEHYYAAAPAKDHLDRLLYIDVKITLGDSDLRKVTSAAGLAGVLTRFPFLDRAVAEFSGTIPVEWKVKGLKKRYLFKQAFRSLLPIEVIRKRKHGFGIPVALWMKSDPKLRELSRDVLLSAKFRERGYFRRSFVEDMLRAYDADDTTYYGDVLWNLFVLELWHREFMDAPALVVA